MERRLAGEIPALAEVALERHRQDVKWGEQDHPDGTGPKKYPVLGYLTSSLVSAEALAERAKKVTDTSARHGLVTWREILLEEVFEALAEDDSAELRKELIQVAAVATQWVEAIDRRGNR